MYKASEGREDSREGNRYQMTNFTKIIVQNALQQLYQNS